MSPATSKPRIVAIALVLFTTALLKSLKGKMIVFVLRQLQYAPNADDIVVFVDRRVEEHCAFPDFMTNGENLAALMQTHGGGKKEGVDDDHAKAATASCGGDAEGRSDGATVHTAVSSGFVVTSRRSPRS